MVVGYAAFATQLNINGTTSITSNWDIKITNITSKGIVGDATDEESQVVDDLTASFKVNLVSPGDSIMYDITVKNNGNINAELEKININKQTSSAINITYEGIEAGEILNSSDSITFTVKVEYNPNITSQPKDTTSTFEMTLDYVEAGKAGEIGTSTTGTFTMGGQTVSLIDDGDGLYADEYESGRYVYKGAKPNNYITFNGEQWRIIAVEADGAIKIMRNSSVTTMAFDTANVRVTGYCSSDGRYGCNAWAAISNFHDALNRYSGEVTADSSLKIYLNDTYYSSISKNKTAIANHLFYYGSTEKGNNDLANQIRTEKEFSVASNVGLIQASDYLKSNTNTEDCGTNSLVNSNGIMCISTTWMVLGLNYFTLTPDAMNSWNVFTVNMGGTMYTTTAKSERDIYPSLYLKSDIELEGEGTSSSPYTITNYLE